MQSKSTVELVAEPKSTQSASKHHVLGKKMREPLIAGIVQAFTPGMQPKQQVQPVLP